MKENPYCETEEDWQGFAVALLPGLAFLECHAIQREERESASVRHQGDIFRAQNQEEQQREVEERAKEEKASERRLKAAFVASLRGVGRVDFFFKMPLGILY